MRTDYSPTVRVLLTKFLCCGVSAFEVVSAGMPALISTAVLRLSIMSSLYQDSLLRPMMLAE